MHQKRKTQQVLSAHQLGHAAAAGMAWSVPTFLASRMHTIQIKDPSMTDPQHLHVVLRHNFCRDLMLCATRLCLVQAACVPA
jgi:hypothetical protein